MGRERLLGGGIRRGCKGEGEGSLATPRRLERLEGYFGCQTMGELSQHCLLGDFKSLLDHLFTSNFHLQHVSLHLEDGNVT